MRTTQKFTNEQNQQLSSLQKEWVELIKKNIGKPVGIRIYNPEKKEYTSLMYDENVVKVLLETIPTDDVIRYYFSKC